MEGKIVSNEETPIAHLRERMEEAHALSDNASGSVYAQVNPTMIRAVLEAVNGAVNLLESTGHGNHLIVPTYCEPCRALERLKEIGA